MNKRGRYKGFFLRVLLPALLSAPVLLAAAILPGGCSLFSSNEEEESRYLTSFPREAWGEWIGLDGYHARWYINAGYGKQGENNEEGYILNGASPEFGGRSVDLAKNTTFTPLSSRVLRVSEQSRDYSRTYTLLGSRIPASSFTGRVVVSEGSPGGRKVTVQNDYNENLSETCTTGPDGSFTARNVIIGDPYTISSGAYRKSFTPRFDGDTAGALNLTDRGNIQCTLTPLPLVNPWMLYAGKDFDFTLAIENHGASDYMTPSYALSYDPAILEVTVSPNVSTIATLEPGAMRQLKLTFRAAVTEDRVIPLGIRFTESFTGAVWEDEFAVRFYPGPMQHLEIRNDSFDNTVAVILPGGTGWIFAPGVIGHDGITTTHFGTMELPRSTREYLLVFTHTGYPWKDAVGNGAFWLGFDTPMGNTQGVLKAIPDTEKDEPMDSEDRAKVLKNVKEIKGFLHEGDIDFYKLTLPPEG
jgi:hypothetical protein